MSLLILIVERHGGRTADRFRIVYSGPEFTARKRYEKVAVALRQGTVRLTSLTGEVLAQRSAPRLRTRW